MQSDADFCHGTHGGNLAESGVRLAAPSIATAMLVHEDMFGRRCATLVLAGSRNLYRGLPCHFRHERRIPNFRAHRLRCDPGVSCHPNRVCKRLLECTLALRTLISHAVALSALMKAITSRPYWRVQCSRTAGFAQQMRRKQRNDHRLAGKTEMRDSRVVGLKLHCRDRIGRGNCRIDRGSKVDVHSYSPGECT